MKKMTFIATVLACLFVLSSGEAADNFISLENWCNGQSGATWDSSNHICSVNPDAIVQVSAGNTLLIAAGEELLNEFTDDISFGVIDNYGTIDNRGFIVNRGILINNSAISNTDDAMIENWYGLSNLGVIGNTAGGLVVNHHLINNFGDINNAGTFQNLHNLYILHDGTFTNASSASFINIGYEAKTGILGSVNNSGVIENLGSIENQYSGYINNVGTILNKRSIYNICHDTWVNACGKIDNYGTITNEEIDPDFAYFRIVNDGTITNYGTIDSTGWCIWHGPYHACEHSTSLENNGVIDNYGRITAIVSDYAPVTPILLAYNSQYGTINNFGQIVIGEGAMFLSYGIVINSGTVDNEGIIRNGYNGILQNEHGSFVNNYGTIDSSATFNNYGTINNYGIITDQFHSVPMGTELNNCGIIRNFPNAVIGVTLTINNYGQIVNYTDATLTIEASALLNNYSITTIDNYGTIKNYGTINNPGTINNYGTVAQYSDSEIIGAEPNNLEGGIIKDIKIIRIDIKPGSDLNCFNNDGQGVIPVAILTSDAFDAKGVDPLTVMLDGAEARVKGKSGNTGSLEDIDADGDLDLVIQIEDMDNTYEPGDTTAILSGMTHSDDEFEGKDSICIVP